MATDIGFIGVGKMGFGMAGNIRKKMPATATLHIYDVNRAACHEFVQKFSALGPIEIRKTSKEVAARSKTVLSMVPMDAHARTVYLDGKNGVIGAPVDSDRLILECSTISVTATKEIGAEIIKSGIGHYVDTPVSGGVTGAEAGTLAFFCGAPGDDPLVTRIRDVVSWMAKAERINFCGGLGTGLVSKIVNNYMGLTNIAVAAQGMAFGLRYGMDPKTLYKCIKGSSGDSWAMDNAQPAPSIHANSPSSNGFQPGFATHLCIKDLSLGIKAAQEVGIDASLGETAVKLFEKANQDPRTGGLDCTSIWLHINDQVAAFAESQNS
ncbi:3-hydroxyisobutyrate dehydrogenase, putative [Paecilomyces variotii No. 5]|uniref:3-hydroxyisobutyrate dehydrogenase, putative n=1 Tax=Byssochlamys spectabilis (strain No. 5 / NBRC 109023) TaxID=1356009 RepID=V5FPT9_BYSSN|nr:3-hydroxyisobutyrate dehydrogenase, putative [Paecilomyces variotii No. 5]